MRMSPYAVLVAACSAPLLLAPVPSGALEANVQQVGFGDPSSGGHRHQRKTDDSKPAPADTPAKPIVPETEAQHRAYLNQYGFGEK
jgi:hypothetical protein